MIRPKLRIVQQTTKIRRQLRGCDSWDKWRSGWEALLRFFQSWIPHFALRFLQLSPFLSPFNGLSPSIIKKKETHSVYTRIEKKKYCFLSVNAQKRRWEIKISVLMLSRWFFVCTGTQYVSRSVHPCHQRATLISNSCAAAGEIWSINRRRHTTGLRRCCCLLAISVYLMGERTVRQRKAVMILLLSTFLRCGEKAWKLTLPSKRLLLLKVILSSLNQNWANFPDSNVSVLHASSNEGRITK